MGIHSPLTENGEFKFDIDKNGGMWYISGDKLRAKTFVVPVSDKKDVPT